MSRLAPHRLPPEQLLLFDASTAAAAASTPATPPAAPPTHSHGPLRNVQTARHERSIHLGGRQIGYDLRRARRRSIGLSIGANGLAVAAPRWVTLAEVEQALLSKASWILRKLDEQRARAQRQQAARIDWRHGARLDYLGAPLQLQLGAEGGSARLLEAPTADADAADLAPLRRLQLPLPADAPPAQVRDLTRAWLQRQARRLFEERCAHFAPLLAVRLRRLALSSAATRWGSASASGAIRLHWRLVQFSPALIDYVVVHELAHLREMNHSPAFWALVRSVLPDCDQARQLLRAQVLPPWD